MAERVVVVSDEGLGGVVPFGRTARELGYEPVLISGPAPLAALERWRTVYAEVRVLPDPYAAATLAAAAVELAGGRPPAALFSCYDGLVLPAATAAAQLGLPHPALGGLLRSRHKDLTREATAAAGLATPRFARIGSLADCTAAAAAVGFPAIVKPLNGMASHLVLRVHDEAELRAAYQRLAIGVQRSFRGNYAPVYAADAATGGGATAVEPVTGCRIEAADPSTTFLVEELLEGPEYSAEVVVRGGRIERVALFEKFLIDPRGFLERGFTSPPLRADRTEPLWAHIEACLRALGVDDAACHVELVDTARGPVLIENNAGRAGGQILVRAVRESRGIDLIAEIVALQCGLPAPARQAPALAGRVTTLTVFPPASGRLVALTGIDAVRALPGVVDVLPFCAPGDRIDVDDKEFFAVNLLVSGLEPVALRALADHATELVRFEIEPAPREPTGDGLLRPSATLAELRSAGAGADRRVRVAGRLLHAGGVWLLADGDASVPLRFAPGTPPPPALAWVLLDARWNAAALSLEQAHAVYASSAGWGTAAAAAAGLPEAAHVADPRLLQPVIARSRLIRFLRGALDRRGFLEVQTPFLHAAAEAAHVDQLETRSVDGGRLYLRTDPEEYLKRYLTAGLDAVYELCANVRGERPDATHLQEFTSLECYRRFWTLDDAIDLCAELVRGALALFGSGPRGALDGTPVDFSPPLAVRSFGELVREYAGIDHTAYPTAASLAAAVRARGGWPGTGGPLDAFRRTWLERLFDVDVLPRLDRPTVVTDFPEELGLSARERPGAPGVTLRAELYLPGGLELAHLYENLTEPEALRARYAARLEHRIAAGLPRVPLDEGLLGSAALGMPPMAGLALGVDRLLLLIRGRGTVADGLLFPHEGFATP